MTITGHILAHARRTSAALLSAALIVASFAGCSDNIPEGPDTPPGREPQIYLDLDVKAVESLADDAPSRADGDYSFEEPTLQDEKLNSLEIIIIDKTENKVEHHRYVEYDEGGHIKHNDNLRFPVKSGDKKIYLFGNVSSLPSDVISRIRTYTKDVPYDPTGNIFESMTVTRASDEPYLASRTDIPMSEAFDITVIPLAENEDNRFQPHSLFVTRLATKFTILVDNRYVNNNISVNLDRMATTQYLLPRATYKPEKGVTANNGRDITEFASPTPDNDLTKGYSWVLEKTFTTEDYAGVTMREYNPVYLMETPGDEFKMSICLNDKCLDAKPLPNLPRLPRNTHVKVYIKSIQGQPEIEVVLQPYKEVILNPGFGL